ncbi:MAG TPA: response regulator [Thermoanaerobaculia bacterium]|nr:response regulator [Thermoanaerobaculia bacterium]
MRLEKRILIVDDDDAIRALVTTVLRRRGYGLDTARNGVDALEKLSTCRYALVILDLMMPRLSGYGVLEHLARQPAATRPLVLVLTAGLEPKPFDQGFVVGTMHKPFDIELLLDTVSGCLSAAMAQEQLETCLDASLGAPAQPVKEEPN